MIARLIVTALIAFAPAARAEYACSVTYGSPAYLGTGGGISVWTAPNPACVGPYTTRVICSIGATHFQCGQTINFSGAVVLAHFDALVRAANTSQPVQFSLGACASGNANNCVNGVLFMTP